jgi:small-conductance mechanosensitive channel
MTVAVGRARRTFSFAPEVELRRNHVFIRRLSRLQLEEIPMHGIIYIVGLVVVVLFILSALGLR